MPGNPFELTQQQKSLLSSEENELINYKLLGIRLYWSENTSHMRMQKVDHEAYIDLLLQIEDLLFKAQAFNETYLTLIQEFADPAMRQLAQTGEQKVVFAGYLEKNAIIFQTAANKTSDEAKRRNFKNTAFKYCQEAGHLRDKLITEANYFSRMKELYEKLTPTLPVFMQEQFASNISLLENDRPASSESPAVLTYRRRFFKEGSSTLPRKGGSEEIEPLLRKTPPGKEKFH